MSTPPFDTATPNVARMYDYWLGGTDNFEADRQAAEAVRKIRPNVAEQALGNKRFQTRAVTYVAGHGVRQFLDIGSGLPTSPVPAPRAEPQWLATHEAARQVMPDAMVAYVDHDSIAVQHSRVLLGDGHDAVVAVEADMRDPKAILADDDIRAAGFDLDAPACVVLACVLHFVDAETARGIANTFARMLAPGSYLVISVGFGRGREGTDFASTYNAQNGPRIYSHSWEEITSLFDGLELVPPGIAETSEWHPGQPGRAVGDRESMIVAGVARRPLTPVGTGKGSGRGPKRRPGLLGQPGPKRQPGDAEVAAKVSCGTLPTQEGSRGPHKVPFAEATQRAARHHRHHRQCVVPSRGQGGTREVVTCPCRHTARSQEPAQCGNATVV